MFNIWRQRNLSIIGKVQIIKTYGTSQLIYITNMISTPLDVIKQANTIFYNFLWNGPDKIKRNTMIAEYHQGGLKMPHFESIITTQKIMWAKRYLSFNFHPWKEFLNMGLTKIGIDNIMNRKMPEKIIKSSCLSTFNRYSELLEFLSKCASFVIRHRKSVPMAQCQYKKTKWCHPILT